MSIFYSRNREERGGAVAPYHTWKANDRFLEHFDNYLILSFMAQTSPDRREREQAREELAICERKMNYWKTHPNYDQAVVTRGCEQRKKNWGLQKTAK